MRGGVNRRHRRAGPLFQNRYQSIVVEAAPSRLERMRYLHLNPLRATGAANLRALGQSRGNVSLAAKRGTARAAAWRAQIADWCR